MELECCKQAEQPCGTRLGTMTRVEVIGSFLVGARVDAAGEPFDDTFVGELVKLRR